MIDCCMAILAAGNGSRMKSGKPKVFHKICGKEMVRYPIDLGKRLGISNIMVVVNRSISESKLFSDVNIVIQECLDGTGGAMMSCLPYLCSQYVLITSGDTPFITESEISSLLNSNCDISIIGANLPGDMTEMPYGHIILKDNKFDAIVEKGDNDEKWNKSNISNSGVYKIKTDVLKKYIQSIEKNKNSGEFYLTDVINLAAVDGVEIEVIINSNYSTLHGINTQIDLEYAELFMQRKLRKYFQENGVIMQDPQSIFFSYDTIIGPGTEIEPHVVFRNGVIIKQKSLIKSFSYLENCTIHECSEIGPFARIRGGTEIESKSVIGNFVEIKGSHLSVGVKTKHLAYIGDSQVGEFTNIGAGTITCNYDGKNKNKTTIGGQCMIGANTSLIAPISIGDNVVIGAGSVITQDVPDNTLSLSRPQQIIKKRDA